MKTKEIVAIPDICHKGLRIGVFQLFGFSGYLLGVVAALYFSIAVGLSPHPVVLLSLLALVVFFATVKLREWMVGDGSLVYYHHKLILLTVVIMVLKALRYPIYPYLDAIVLGLGLCLMLGRMGCAMAGCCHGFPAKWGIHYRRLKLYNGIPRVYKGLPIFPVQLLESLVVFVVLVVGIAVRLAAGTEGILFFIYITSYGCLRFFLEFYRGDVDRPHRLGLSEAQWISIGLLWLSMLSMEQVGFRFWLLQGIVTTTVTAVAWYSVSLFLNDRRAVSLLTPSHIIEIIEIVNQREENTLYRSSKGVAVSFCDGGAMENRVFTVTLSGLACRRGPAVADRLSKIIFNARRIRRRPSTPLDNKNGVYQYWGQR